MTQATYTRLKSRLTRVENVFRKAKQAHIDDKRNTSSINEAAIKAAKALKAEAEYGISIFEEQGYPDSHHRWERAKDDAAYLIRRLTNSSWA
jgi:hypothetical protein